MAQKKWFSAKNQEASALRQRKYRLIRQYDLPENPLGGHLAVTYRRCGKPTCHCAQGRGHPRWSLSFSVEGRKQTELLPEDLALELAPLVDEGRGLREAVMELLAINLKLFRLWKKERRDRRPATGHRRRHKKPARSHKRKSNS
jgi:hypothetical protein